MEIGRRNSCHDAEGSTPVTIDRMLFVEADLVVEIGGEQMFIRGQGSNIVVEIPSVAVAVKMARNLGSLTAVRGWLVTISSALATVGLTVILRTPRRRLLTIGRQGNSWLLRLFGFPNSRLHVY